MEGREESWCILTITPAAHRHQHHERACKRTGLQTASFGFIRRFGEKEGFSCISDEPLAPIPELEECLLTTTSLHPLAMHAHSHTDIHTHTQTNTHFLFAFGTWITEGFCS